MAQSALYVEFFELIGVTIDPQQRQFLPQLRSVAVVGLDVDRALEEECFVERVQLVLSGLRGSLGVRDLVTHGCFRRLPDRICSTDSANAVLGDVHDAGRRDSRPGFVGPPTPLAGGTGSNPLVGATRVLQAHDSCSIPAGELPVMALSHRDVWDTRHVKSALATGGMPEAKVFLYFLAITTFDWLQFTAFRIWPNPEPLSLPAEFEAWFGLGITVAGVVFLFLCNGGGQGKDFLYRYFPLAVVVGWKFVVAMVVASWALSRVLAGQPENVTRWSVVALGCLGNALMFLRIGQHLKALSRGTG